MRFVTSQSKITLEELKELASQMFGNLVKAVIDVKKEEVALQAELHSDLEASLLEQGSSQNNLWGINLYPDTEGENFIEFDSMINLRPSQGNVSRGVDSPEIQDLIRKIVANLITT